MTPEEQRIAIAEACGLDVKMCPIHHSVECCGRHIPDYPNDLNAMFQAEKCLEVDQKENDYQMHLHDVVVRGREGLTVGLVWYLEIDATAAQRAEAFLKCLGLWKES